jgi:hypothetical protein
MVPGWHERGNAAPPAGAAIPIYRYGYEPDRILAIDPATNIAIQADALRGYYSGSFLAPSVTALGSTSR